MSSFPLQLVLLALCTLPGLHAAVGDGFWRTDGNQIKDAAGNVVRFSGVNWHGMDSENLIPHGLWGQANPARVHSIEDHLDEMKTCGFNLIRLAFSSEIFIPGQKPRQTAIDPTKNADLLNKTCLEILDRIVASAGARGIRIILDYHRLTGGGAAEDGHWYDGAHPETQWIANWKALATRYKNDPTVVGADLFNEVHGPVTWKADNVDVANNWRWAAKRCANEILAIHPNLLICVQGLHSYNGQGGWWGAVHLGLKDHPLTLNVANRLVYQVHDYGPVVWDQPFHQVANGFPNSLTAHWDTQWGFIHNDNLGPIWVGEWGSFLNQAQIDHLENEQGGDQNYDDRGQREINGWFPKLRDYIDAKNLSWTWWTWTPESRDTGGILNNDYSVNTAKANLLNAVKYPAFAPSGPGVVPPTNSAPTAVINGTPASGTAPVTVSFNANGSSDPDGDTLTYAWTFGDGGTATGQSPSHTYTTNGVYTATVTVSDGHAHHVSATKTITVSSTPPPNSAPTALISATPAIGTTPLAVAFSAAGSSDPDGDTLTYAWTFGDGGTATGVAPSHTYVTVGSFTVTLVINDGHSHTANATKVIVTNASGGAPSTGTPAESGGKCGMGGGIAAMLLTLVLSLRLRRRSLV